MARVNGTKTFSPLFLFDDEFIEEEKIDDLIEEKKEEIL